MKKKNEHKDEKNRDDKQYMKKEPINDEKMVNENDKLFWFWYIFTHGYEKYEFLGKNKYKTEMKIKTNLVEMINKKKKELKKLKIKLNDIEQEIIYSKKISINSFMVILYVTSINLVYFTDVVYYEINNEVFDKKIIIYHDKKNDIFEMKNNVIIEEIKKKKYIITSLNKQIKAISSYKSSELKNICDKLSINYMKTANKSITKKEIYEKIVQKIS